MSEHTPISSPITQVKKTVNIHEPVRMVWNAISTFEASSADVSINDSPLSAATFDQHRQLTPNDEGTRTRERLGFVGGHSPQVLQIALIPHEHDDDVRICMIPELLQPPRDVDVGRVLGDVINQKRTHRTAVVSATNQQKRQVGHRAAGAPG